MTKPKRPSPTLRLFVALDLPEDVRGAIARWQAEGLADPALRPMRPEALHVTLCFLDRHPEAAVARIAELLGRAPDGPVTLQFDPEASPMPKGRPRLYAIGGVSESASALQAELARTLGAEGFYKPEKRGFWPHVTVARVRSERLAPEAGQRRGKGRPRRVKQAPKPLPKRLTAPFGAVRIALYRSDLKPQGAEYVRLAGVDLPSPEGPRTQKR